MERRLGRGLGSLLSDPGPSEPQAEIDIARIRPNPFQPRRSFDPESLAALKSSIERHGVLQPLVLRPALEGYELISGERRWRAAKAAGLRAVPAVIRPGVRDEEMLELALVENLQRADLDPIERAGGFLALIETLGLTQEQVGARIGLPRATVTNHLRLLELPDQIQDAVGKGLISMGHAKALMGARSPSNQLRFLADIVRDGLSVREIERRVRLQGPSKVTSSARSRPETPPWVVELETRMRQALGTKVRIQNHSDYRGEIVLEYFDQPTLERLIDVLAPRALL